MIRPHLHKVAWRQAAINAAIFIAVFFVFGTQLGGLAMSLKVFGHANWLLAASALVVVICTFPVAALSYYILADDPVKLRPTLKIQIASGFINRLLPGGLGSLGLFARYFRKQGLTTAAATAAVATNTILGFIGSILLASVIFVVNPSYTEILRGHKLSTTLLWVFLFVTLISVVILVLEHTTWRDRIRHAVRSGFTALRLSLRPDRRTALGLFYNLLLTSLYALALSISVSAVGGSLGWPAAMLVLSVGTLIGVAVPTPGGIGGVEAGLLAGMVVFGVQPAVGLAAVLLYRGLTYWLPIIPGILMFRYVEKRYL